MSVTRRLVSSFGASILGPVVTILVQVINVPVMLRSWGPQLYGEWLLLSAIPTYLLLSDMGFGNVAGSDMTMRFNAGDNDGALETFQSTQALVLLATAVIVVILAVLLAVVPIHRILHLSALSPSETHTTMLLLSINCLVLLQWSVIMSGYRCTGRYALGMFYANCIRIVEGATVFIVLFSKARPPQLAAFMLIVSVLGTSWLVYQHHRRMPWLHFGFRLARWKRIRQLSTPAFAYMAFPACGAIGTQGMTMMVGLTLSPLAVALFNPMRTMARAALQLSNAILNSFWQELSAAFGQNNLALARKLHRSACQLAFGFAIAACGVLVFAGPLLFALWTHHQLAMDVPAFYILLAGTIAYSAWSASSAVPLAANKHQRLAILYLICSSSSLIAGYVLTRLFALKGAALAMLLCDLAMSVYVVRASNRLLSDRWPDFAASLFDATHLRSLRNSISRFLPMSR